MQRDITGIPSGTLRPYKPGLCHVNSESKRTIFFYWYFLVKLKINSSKSKNKDIFVSSLHCKVSYCFECCNCWGTNRCWSFPRAHAHGNLSRVANDLDSDCFTNNTFCSCRFSYCAASECVCERANISNCFDSGKVTRCHCQTSYFPVDDKSMGLTTSNNDDFGGANIFTSTLYAVVLIMRWATRTPAKWRVLTLAAARQQLA